MKRRYFLLLTALGVMAAIAALAQQKPAPASKLLLLEWASKAKEAEPPVAIVIEMGLKDATPNNWSGRVAVSGAKVVHREGYRFRPDDKLVEPDGWEASSHRPLRAQPKTPAAVTLEPVATVGIVLHLADVKPDAVLSLSIKEQEIDKVSVPLKDVLAGQANSLQKGRLTVRRISTSVPAYTAPTEDDFPAAAYGPDGTLWLAWIAYHVQEEERRIEPPQLKGQPKDFKDYYEPGYHDQLLVKYFKNGKWSNPFAVTDAKQSLMRCAIAVDKDGVAVVAYSANRNGIHDIYTCSLDLRGGDMVSHPTPKISAEVKLTGTGSPIVQGVLGLSRSAFISPVLAARPDGSLLLICQCWGAGGAEISQLVRRKGNWEGWSLQGNGANIWHPVVAIGPQGQTRIAYDSNWSGDYDVTVFNRDDEKWSDTATSSRFEARPSICYDPQGRLWIAYEDGPEGWGKDFGPFDDQDGNPLYFRRTVKVVCLQDGKLMRPVAELPPIAPGAKSPETGQQVEAIPRYAHPKIGIDGKGRVWVTYRVKHGSRYTSHPGSYWTTVARRLDGDKWTEPIDINHSDGLLDDRPVLLPHSAGGLRIIHNTDGRFSTPENVNNQIYMSYVDLPGEPGASATGVVEPKLVAHDPGKKDPKTVAAAKAEAADVKRIRDYRIDADGKKLQLLRGEFHRHTELSWDGGPDGSLEDMWRYGIDAAAMDWIGNGDHDSGAGREYSWWLVQKTTDAYHVKGRFTTMFTYERSVSYPHGHRNCMFVQRGVRTLPRLAEPDKEKQVAGIHADDTKMLYRYLREHNGICAVHTSATGMGTDWRDNDPVVEPFVEIYQGLRMTNEYLGAPRAGWDAKSGKKPVNIGGWQPLGFLNHAFAKGYKLAFQASSDHFSTHISYCIVLAERPDRQALLDACKKRHVYGATDNIILDVRSGNHIMGDEFKSSLPPNLQIKVIGTGPLAKVEILKDSEVVHTYEPKKAEFEAKWTDPAPKAGVHYYYVRVQQADGELAWGSPMWIER